MACNCKSELEEKVTQRLKEQYPDGENHSASLDHGYIYAMDDFGMRGRFEFKNEVSVRTRKETLRKVKPQLGMVFTYCPFCGVKYKPDEDHADASL